MKATKISHKIHLWLSVPFGIVITLICFSGSMLVFEPEITRAVRSDVYYVEEVKDTPLPMEQLRSSVAGVLPEGVNITRVEISPDMERTYAFYLSKPRRSIIYVDQYSGKVTGRHERLPFFISMIKLHRTLLVNPAGKMIVGISTITFIIVLLTGVILWIPRARGKFRRSLPIKMRGGMKKFLKSLHVAGGIYVTLFLLLMALTGLTWSFEGYRQLAVGTLGLRQPTLYALHTGAIGGMTTRILWFIAALLGATLPLTGYYIWLRKMKK